MQNGALNRLTELTGFERVLAPFYGGIPPAILTLAISSLPIARAALLCSQSTAPPSCASRYLCHRIRFLPSRMATRRKSRFLNFLDAFLEEKLREMRALSNLGRV